MAPLPATGPWTGSKESGHAWNLAGFAMSPEEEEEKQGYNIM